MAKIKGICKNIDGCDLAADKVVQEVDSFDFKCEECGRELSPLEEKKKKKSSSPLPLIIGAAAVVLLAILGILLLSGGKPKVEKLTLDRTKMTLKVGQTDQLNVKVEPEDAQPQLFWQSTNDSVLTVANGVVTALKAGKAQVKVSVLDKEDVSAVCAFTIVVEDVDLMTLDIIEDQILLRPGGHQQLMVDYSPDNQTEVILWRSSNDSIAKVTHKGKVEAIGVGEAIIFAKSDRSEITDSTKVIVEGPLVKEEEEVAPSKPSTVPSAPATPAAPAAKPKPSSAPVAPVAKPKPTPTPTPASGSKNLGYATFKGSWPNDVNGRMVFKSSHVIDSKDPKKRVAEAGDYVIGEWVDGHLVQGIWYGSDNQVKGSVIIGR